MGVAVQPPGWPLLHIHTHLQGWREGGQLNAACMLLKATRHKCPHLIHGIFVGCCAAQFCMASDGLAALGMHVWRGDILLGLQLGIS